MRGIRTRALVVAVLLSAATLLGLGGATANAGEAPPQVLEEKVLPHQYQVQETGYWCSAAAARIALSARGVNVSQADLAAQLQISPDIGLPNIANLENALDQRTGSTYYQVKQWSSDAELREKLRADVLYNVDRGHAVVLNVVRIADATFPGGHYATIVGYRNGGAEYLIADPASASRQSIWLGADDVAGGVKLRRYVA